MSHIQTFILNTRLYNKSLHYIYALVSNTILRLNYSTLTLTKVCTKSNWAARTIQNRYDIEQS